MFLNVILFLLILWLMYQIVDTIHERKIIQKVNKYLNEKNDNYYKEFIRNSEKMKKVKLPNKLNLFHKINLMIDRASLKRSILLNPMMLIFYGVICFAIAYAVAFKFFKIVMLSFIISLPSVLLPIILIAWIGNQKEEKIEKIFLNFLLQLKNNIKISKDIVGAFKSIRTEEPLSSYIKTFLVEVESGTKFERAIENLKEKINIVKFKEFFSNLQYCYLYGGDIATLIDKSYLKIEEVQKEKQKRLEETKSARLVLIILMALDMIVYVAYINNNYENYMIMKNTFIGTIILYWNFISMWLLALMASKVKKLDY